MLPRASGASRPRSEIRSMPEVRPEEFGERVEVSSLENAIRSKECRFHLNPRPLSHHDTPHFFRTLRLKMSGSGMACARKISASVESFGCSPNS